MKKIIKFILVLFALFLIFTKIGGIKNKESVTLTPTYTQSVGTPINQNKKCQAPFSVGYRIVKFNGVQTAIWYPSSDNENNFEYSKDFTSKLAREGIPNSECGRFPLILFSHGLGGCGTQSIFFTEELARHGYVVAAPDHKDALCSVSGGTPSAQLSITDSIIEPEKWNDQSSSDRREDVENVINGLLKDGQLSQIIDSNKIGVTGHSLGGYTVLGIAGAWPSWHDQRIKAVLGFSPYVQPYTIKQTISGVKVPIMYQGSDFDIGITPFIDLKDGAYNQSNKPKYFVKFKGGNHFIWTNLECFGEKTLEGCLKNKPQTKLINSYAFAFFDKYLKGFSSELLNKGSDGLSAYKSDL